MFYFVWGVGFVCLGWGWFSVVGLYGGGVVLGLGIGYWGDSLGVIVKLFLVWWIVNGVVVIGGVVFVFVVRGCIWVCYGVVWFLMFDLD